MAIKPPWFDPQVLVGTTLHGYRLEELLGAGALAQSIAPQIPKGKPGWPKCFSLPIHWAAKT